MPSKKSLLITTIILVLMIIGAGLGVYSTRFYRSGPAPDSMQGLLWPNPKQLGEFNMIDQQGNSFNLDNLKGKWSQLFFGYTYCPDVCPLTLTMLSQIHDRVKQQIKPGYQTIFVSVDPARDTTARLADYISYFHPDFIALGGSAEQVNSLTSQIGITMNHGAIAADGSYMVNHSTSIFLVDPSARLVGITSAPHNADTIVHGLVTITDFLNRQD